MAGGVHAGSDANSAPVVGRFSADSSVVRPQASFRVALEVKALQDIRQGRVSFHPRACAVFNTAADRLVVFDLGSGQSQVFTAAFTLQSPGPCSVVAEVLTLETATTRQASVFGLTVNPVAAAPVPGVRHGQTADGQKTIEAPAASR